ncbi:sensor histidine kinase [Nocardioides iriomotensis]|uniref:sensor histidine kinase n=1 Tax=Nocardioides iriomotensis TaxID=715784 RepID=UPI0013ED244C|nr:HAMP domain-containing sensor histidine kinase [Nocardioides iriomotensis]
MTSPADPDREREDALLDAVGALLRSNDDLASFAARVAHDLRSPLGAIIGQLQLADGLLDPDVPERTLAAVRAALGAAERMRRTVDDVLAYATLDLRPRTEPVDVAAVVRQVVGDLEARIREAGGTVEAPASLVVDSDPTLLAMLVQNLVQNALVHAGPAPHVVVDVGTVDDAGWWLEVHDDGLGVPADKRSWVFEPLARGSGASGSTGTGLATCARVAEALGGTIAVGDSHLGGAAFRVAVPAVLPR